MVISVSGGLITQGEAASEHMSLPYQDLIITLPVRSHISRPHGINEEQNQGLKINKHIICSSESISIK